MSRTVLNRDGDPQLPVDFDRHESNALFDLHFGTERDTGEPVLRKVSRDQDTAPWLIHTEVAVGERLAAVPWPGGYPASLCRLVDQGTEDGRPYVTTTYRGRALTAWGAPLRLDEVLTVFADLLEAVQGLAKVGKAHGAITPGSVLWDGTHAQLVDLGEAAGIGEPYRPTLVDPAWRPPGAAGGLLAGPAHDVYQVGMVIFCVLNRVAPVDAATARAALPGTSLATLLVGVFADDPAERPDPHALLRRVDDMRAVVEPSSEVTQRIAVPAVVGRAAPVAVPPPSAARLEYRRKAAAKRDHRRRVNRPALVTGRYCRELFEILWYSWPSVPKRVALVVAALLASPFVGFVMLVRYVGGDR